MINLKKPDKKFEAFKEAVAFLFTANVALKKSCVIMAEHFKIETPIIESKLRKCVIETVLDLQTDLFYWQRFVKPSIINQFKKDVATNEEG